jgi:hypothetical protein
MDNRYLLIPRREVSDKSYVAENKGSLRLGRHRALPNLHRYSPITFFIRPITSSGWFITSLAKLSISSP